MKQGSKKSPIQVPRSKEELEREIKINNKRRLIKEDFYPSLKDLGYSVEETGLLLGAISSLIMAEAMETLNVIKGKQIANKFAKKLTDAQEGQGLLGIEKLLNLFKDLSLFEIRGHVEAMKQVIEQMKLDEFQAKKLSDMNPNWDKYLS
jgi:hypothetical protein